MSIQQRVLKKEHSFCILIYILPEELNLSFTSKLRCKCYRCLPLLELATMKLNSQFDVLIEKWNHIPFVRASVLWSSKESGLMEKVFKYSRQYISGGTFENVVLQGGWSYKEWSYSETGLYFHFKSFFFFFSRIFPFQFLFLLFSLFPFWFHFSHTISRTARKLYLLRPTLGRFANDLPYLPLSVHTHTRAHLALW